MVDRGAGQVALRSPRRARSPARRRRRPARSSASGSPVAAAPLVAGADADDAAVVDEQLLRRPSPAGSSRRPPRPARRGSGRARETETTQLPWFVIVGGGGMRSALPLRQEVDGLAAAPRRRSACPRCASRPANSLRSARGFIDRAGEQVRARLLALLEHRDRHLAEPLAHVRVLLEQLAEPDRAREPARPGADDQDADLDPLVGRVGRRRRSPRRRERRRVVGRADAASRLLARPHELGQLRDDLRAGRRRRRGRRTRRSARSGPC